MSPGLVAVELANVVQTQSRTYEYPLVRPRRPEGVDGNIHTNGLSSNTVQTPFEHLLGGRCLNVLTPALGQGAGYSEQYVQQSKCSNVSTKTLILGTRFGGEESHPS